MAHEASIDVVHDRRDGPVAGDVLDIDLGLLSGRAVHDRDEEIAAILAQARVDDLVRTVALAKDLDITAGLLAEGMIENARAFLAHAGIVEAAFVRLER